MMRRDREPTPAMAACAGLLVALCLAAWVTVALRAIAEAGGDH